MGCSIMTVIFADSETLKYDLFTEQKEGIGIALKLASEIIDDGVDFASVPCLEQFEPSESKDLCRVSFSLKFIDVEHLNLFKLYLQTFVLN